MALKALGSVSEYVLCAAIYVDDGLEHDRRSYSYPRTGLVFAAWRHGDCYTTMQAWADRLTDEERARIDAVEPDQLRGSRQGFLTSTGRFVNREEAAVIACAAGQTSGVDFLTSEHLY